MTLTTARCGPSGTWDARWCRGIAAESAPSCGTPARWRRGERGAKTRGSSAPPGNIPGSGQAGERTAGQTAARWPGAWQGERKSVVTRRTGKGAEDVGVEGPAVVVCRQWIHGGRAYWIKGQVSIAFRGTRCSGKTITRQVFCASLTRLKLIMWGSSCQVWICMNFISNK